MAQYPMQRSTKGNPRPAATTLRSKEYGPADQISYQIGQRINRDNFKAKLKKDHDAAYAAGRRKRPAETGANAGTIGGSRSALFSAMFGR